MAKTKICEIDSQNLVNGSNLMEYNSNLASWHSPLQSLENGSHMFGECLKLKSFNYPQTSWEDVDFTKLNNAKGMFYNSGLTDYVFMYIEELENSSEMFRDCNDLTRVSLRANGKCTITNADYMFEKCYNLEYIQIGGDDRLTINSSLGMFNGCKNLTNAQLDISPKLFDKCTSTGSMFLNCYNLSYIGQYFTEATNIYNMFKGCKNLNQWRNGAQSFGKVVTGSYAFAYTTSLPHASLRMGSLNNGTGMFKKSGIEYCYSYLPFGIDCNCSYMFSYCDNLTDFAGDLSTVKSCDYMFFKDKILNSLYDNSDTIDTLSLANCMTAQYMFAYCYDLCNFDTRMNSRLPLGNEGANGNVITITISPKLKYCTGMFYKHGTPLNTIVFSSAEVPEITNCDSMFEECYKLQSIVGLSAESIKTANKMFMSCHDITSNGVCFEDSEFLNLTKGDYMFHQCGRELGFQFYGKIPKLESCSFMFSYMGTQGTVIPSTVESLPQLTVDVVDLDGFPTKITNLWRVVHGRKIDDTTTTYFITRLAEASTSACAGQSLGTIYIPSGSSMLTQATLRSLIDYGWSCKSNDSNDGTYYTDTLEYYCLDGHAVEITVIHGGSHLSLDTTNDISTANGYCPDAYKNGNGWNRTVLPNITVKRIINGIGYDN